jgi:hypothetical protein
MIFSTLGKTMTTFGELMSAIGLIENRKMPAISKKLDYFSSLKLNE